MDKDDLLKLGKELFSKGLFQVQRDKSLLNDLYTFQAAIGDPLNGRCSSCISKAFFMLRSNIEKLENQDLQIKSNFDMSKKYKLIVPPYRLDSKTVITNDNLTPEIAEKIIQTYPKNWHRILKVEEGETTPEVAEAPKPKRTRKKKEVSE